MEEKNKIEESKLREIYEASTRGNWNTGFGTGPNDCMSMEVFTVLDNKGALHQYFYVCGKGWMRPLNMDKGSGSGSGSGSSSSSGSGSGSSSGSGCSYLECMYNDCDCTEFGTGSGCGSGSGCSSGCGSGCGCGFTCNCRCEYCGDNSGCRCFTCIYNKCDCLESGSGSGSGSHCRCSCDFCGEGSGWDAGNIDMYKAVIHDETVRKRLKEIWREMLANATWAGRQEVGCYIYYDIKKKKYHVGTIKYGMRVSGVDAPIDLDSPAPDMNGVIKEYILVTSCHAHTTLQYENNESIIHVVGPSKTDREGLNAGFGIVLDYEGYFDRSQGNHIISHANQGNSKVIVYIYNGQEVKYKEELDVYID